MDTNTEINALRTRTKYKITKLRTAMKETILDSLKRCFTQKQLEMPMLSVLELRDYKKTSYFNPNFSLLEVEQEQSEKQINEGNVAMHEQLVVENGNVDKKTKSKKKNQKNSNLGGEAPGKKQDNVEFTLKPVKDEKVTTKPCKVELKSSAENKAEQYSKISDFEVVKPEKSTKQFVYPDSSGLDHMAIRMPGLRRYQKDADSSVIFDKLKQKKGARKTNIRK